MIKLKSDSVNQLGENTARMLSKNRDDGEVLLQTSSTLQEQIDSLSSASTEQAASLEETVASCCHGAIFKKH